MANPTFTCPFQGDHKEIKDVSTATSTVWESKIKLEEDETIYFVPNEAAQEKLQENIIDAVSK